MVEHRTCWDRSGLASDTQRQRHNPPARTKGSDRFTERLACCSKRRLQREATDPRCCWWRVPVPKAQMNWRRVARSDVAGRLRMLYCWRSSIEVGIPDVRLRRNSIVASGRGQAGCAAKRAFRLHPLTGRCHFRAAGGARPRQRPHAVPTCRTCSCSPCCGSRLATFR